MIDFDKIELGAAGYTRKKNKIFLKIKDKFYVVEGVQQFKNFGKKTTGTHIVQFGKSRLIVLINFLFFFLLNGFIFYYVGTMAGLYHEISTVLRLIVVVVGTLVPFFIMLVFWIPNNYIFIYKKVDIDKIDVKEKQ